jgi:hypothetical protein
VDQDERQAGIADFAVKVDQGVRPERLRDGLDPGHERELDAHQSQADEAESDGEVGPETQPRPVRAHQREDQGRHADPDEYSEQPTPRTTALMEPPLRIRRDWLRHPV